MKLLSAFSGLLLALQLAGAVHLDQVGQPRFLKVRQTRQVHGTQAERVQPSLKRRGEEEALLKVQEAIQHFEGLTRTSSGGAAHGETLTKLRELEASMKRGAAPPGYETIFQNPNEHTVTEHFYPGQEAGLGQRYGLTPPTHAWEDLNKQKLELAAHEAALQAQARAITEGHVGIAKHSEDIEQLREANSGLQKQLSAQAKSGKWRDFALGSAGAVGTVGAVTGMLYSNEASHKVQENQEHIDALKTEVARLKAQGQLGTSVAGPGAPIQGGPSAGAPQANGGLV